MVITANWYRSQATQNRKLIFHQSIFLLNESAEKHENWMDLPNIFLIKFDHFYMFYQMKWSIKWNKFFLKFTFFFKKKLTSCNGYAAWNVSFTINKSMPTSGSCSERDIDGSSNSLENVVLNKQTINKQIYR